MFPPAGTAQTRLRNILTALRGPASDPERMDALSQLCDYLSVGTEESMVSFSIDTFVPPLVALLGEGNSADTMLLAARALTHLMDALPASASSIAHNNAAPPLCANLLSIEYIDLAEQSLSALEKLSVDFPQPIVRAGGFAAALSFIDFFSTGVQRVAAVTACNMCRAPPSDSMDKIVDVLPAMMNLLVNDDQRIRESMMLGFSRLADSFKTASEKLETLCGGDDADLVERVIGLIVPTSPPSLAPASYAAALRLLVTLARGSAMLSAKLLAAEALLFKLRFLLTDSNSPHALDCLNLIDALLPDTAADAEDTTAQAAITATIAASRAARRRRSSSSTAAFAAIDITRRSDLEKNVESLSFFGKTLLPELVEFYNSSADSSARRVSLSVLTKYLGLAPADVLKPLLITDETNDKPRFAPFVAGLLGENCSMSENLAGLALANFALTKLPEVKVLFAREGVVYEMRRLKVAGEEKAEKDRLAAAAAAETGSAGAATIAAAAAGGGARATGSADGARGSTSETAAAGAASSVANTGAAFADHTSPAAAVAAALAAVGAPRLPLRLAPLRQTASSVDSPAKTVADVARAIVVKHLDAGMSVDEGEDNVLAKLTAVAESLSKAGGLEADLRDGYGALRNLAGVLGNSRGVSTFELSRSGVVDALVIYLAAEGHPAMVRTERTVTLVQELNRHSAEGAFELLVTRVLGTFAAEEKLPVCVSEAPSSSHQAAPPGNGLRQLLQPFKLCLRRGGPASSGADLRDYSHHVVLIEPLATMASVEDFLWPRVQQQQNGQAASVRIEGGEPVGDRPRARSVGDSQSQENEVNDMVLEEDEDDDDIDDGDREHEDFQENEDAHMQDGDDDDAHHDGEEEMFELDEDQIADAHGDGGGGRDAEEEDDDEERVRHSDEDFSSGSEDVIGENEDGDRDHDDMGAGAFGAADQLGSSFPPVELDHDALAMSPRPPSGTIPGRTGSASNAGTSGSAVASGSTPGRVRRNEAAAAPAASSGPPRSYAAALASGMQRLNRNDSTSAAGGDGGVSRRRGRTASSAPAKLAFTLNGHNVSMDSSILSAVLQTRRDGVAVGPRLWSEVYTLVYARAIPLEAGGERDQSEASEAVPAAALASGSRARSSGARVTRRSRRLSGQPASADLPITAVDAVAPSAHSAGTAVAFEEGKGAEHGAMKIDSPEAQVLGPPLSVSEVLNRTDAFVPPLTIAEGLPGPVRNITCLLKHLEWMYRVLQDDGTASQAVLLQVQSSIDFDSQKVNAKLRRQLSDSLALCGGAIPAWCHLLSRDASFLVPFQTRQMLFQSTALGVPRALHMLQLRSDSSSVGGDGGRPGMGHRATTLRESEARINRIQRQKVRIHRSRVLESAMRVMSMYASHGTVLEVEYFDEVGTGLGPTLEFYTLVSRELQRVDLGLWRSIESAKARERKERIAGSPRSPGIDVPGGGGSASAKASQLSRIPRRQSSGSSVRTPSDSCAPPRRDRLSDEPVEYVVPTGHGLMPSCIPLTDTGDALYAQRLAYFPFIGRLVAKALSDGRLLDLRLSPVFSKLLLALTSILLNMENDVSEKKDDAEENRTGASAVPMSHASDGALRDASALSSRLDAISDAELWRAFADGKPGLVLLRKVDPQLAASLQNVLDMAGGQDKPHIADLCMSFVLPENERIELVPGGKDIDVTADNAREYVAAVVEIVLCSGVRRQAEAFLRGFGDVLDVKSLLLFQADELELLICGPSFEEWTADFLVQATRCDHGYRHENVAVVSLLRVLSELDAEDQRRFVLFATGSPALPIGGLMGLRPRLTIVKRTPEGGRSPDECLPTVMTCTNYFKLPDYSCYEVAKARLLYALREGQGSFHLS
jgi:E3 ubiquitin-protein ligase TRIP12